MESKYFAYYIPLNNPILLDNINNTIKEEYGVINSYPILNQIELLSCISVMVGCFSSIFFVVEYKGSPVLSGTSRDLAGLMLVVVCSACALQSLKLMWKDYSSKPICKLHVFVRVFDER